MAKLTIKELKILLMQLEDYLAGTMYLTLEFLKDQNKEIDDLTVYWSGFENNFSILSNSDGNLTPYIYTYAPKDLYNRLMKSKNIVNVIYNLSIFSWDRDASSEIKIDSSFYSARREEHKVYIFHFSDEKGLLENGDSNVEIQLRNQYGSNIYPAWKFRRLMKSISNADVFYLFGEDQKALDIYKGKSLEKYNLTNIDFEGKDVSELDLSSQISNIQLHLDHIQKTLYKANIEGYDGKGYLLKGWDIRDANIKNTHLAVDLLSCMVSYPEKLSSGTQFDEDNTFYLGKKQISMDEARDLGLNIKKKKR